MWKLLLVLCVGVVDTASVKNWKHFKRSILTGCDVPEYFRCASGTYCIEPKYTCDSRDDCGDNSDETLPECPPEGSCTGPHRFPCKNGNCIGISFYCDLMDDCEDGSDEENCDPSACSEDEMRCDIGLCIEPSWLCDGDDDCGNGWDERPENCHPRSTTTEST
ncbi:low-density lipoprotein receptor class A domain-containing protein 3-like [Pomacea canaliculata]|uniref:low-density lipoprotein receptor class A domain-containing protein 3-like n=1 Tax=Pomacea canaliculata TaxID=400727 RepID=UPI000D72EC85|nr:low-density lipoprotein receptor class A domain-containing protein 3-like [Pomacea canaliculata]